jgi:hypothetical protein
LENVISPKLNDFHPLMLRLLLPHTIFSAHVPTIGVGVYIRHDTHLLVVLPHSAIGSKAVALTDPGDMKDIQQVGEMISTTATCTGAPAASTATR